MCLKRLFKKKNTHKNFSSLAKCGTRSGRSLSKTSPSPGAGSPALHIYSTHTHTDQRKEGVCSCCCCCYVYWVSHQVIDLVTGKVVTRSFVYVIGELIRFRKSNIRYVDTISQHFQEYVGVKSLFRLDRRTGSWEKINWACSLQVKQKRNFPSLTYLIVAVCIAQPYKILMGSLLCASASASKTQRPSHTSETNTATEEQCEAVFLGLR